MQLGQKDIVMPWHLNVVDDPVTLSEHLVHRMHHNRNPLLITLEDKFASRAYVKEHSDCQLPDVYHFVQAKDFHIPWNDLPERYVLKSNHWSGDSIFIIDNAKEPLPHLPRARFPKLRSGKQHGYYVIRKGRDQYGRPWPKWRIERKLRRVLKKDFPVSLEWGAYNIKERGIMIEEFLEGDDGGAPTDIKFHCFGGKVGFIQIESGRFGKEIKQNIHLPDGSLIDTLADATKWFNDTSFGNLRTHLGEQRISRMIEVAEQLSHEMDYVRVDLFLIGDAVYYGEFTNYPRSGQPQGTVWEALAGKLWREARGVAPNAEQNSVVDEALSKRTHH
ncbi:MAG: hypothetical protein DWC03_02825 [Candidatus Poseidoniales archaeon]|nr:MAG: hypothetical protein DWC03_02825 [Candidatus Poseidoniales archaeon]